MAARPFLLNPRSLTEIRFLGPRKWAVFTTEAAVVKDALTIPEVCGLDAYQTLNPLAPDTPEKHGVKRDVLFQPGRGQLSTDKDVERRRWLLLDSDVVKATGAAATDEQRAIAHKHSRELEDALTAEGWPLPLAFDTGNGAHRVYSIDLTNDKESGFLISNLLHLMARKFDWDTVRLDKSVSNAGRITRLYGSRNHKAGRDSAVLSVPDVVGLVSLEQMRAVVEKWRGSLGYKKPLAARAGDWTPERIESFLDFYSIDYRPAVEIPAGLLWVLSPCPFDEGHVGTSPAVILTKAGWPKFRCMHHSCSGMKWPEVCRKLYRVTGKWFLHVA